MNAIADKPAAIATATEEASLTARAVRGDPEAFSELACAVFPRMRRIALRVVTDPSDAEDVVQNALWKAFRNVKGFRQESAFSTWLFRITVNEGILLLRKRRAGPVALDDLYPGADFGPGALLPAREKTPEQICISEETSRILHQCLLRVRPTYRTVLLKELGERSHQEIADELGVPVSTVKIRAHRARRELRRLLLVRVDWLGERSSCRAVASVN